MPLAVGEAAKLEPIINTLFETLKFGESDRPKESTLRWQAGYDLAMLLGSLAVGLIVQIDFPRFRTEH